MGMGRVALVFGKGVQAQTSQHSTLGTETAEWAFPVAWVLPARSPGLSP